MCSRPCPIRKGRTCCCTAWEAAKEPAPCLRRTDKAVRVQGTEPLDYGSETGEDLLYASTDSLPADGFRETSPRIATYLKADRPSFSVWGETSDAAISFGTTYSAANPDFGTMFDESAFGNEEFDGYTPEFIVYSRYLTPLERRRAESYLAVKYGITLDGSYLDSDGNLLWDRDEAPAYHNRVAAYGNDAAGGLEQPMSATSYEEAPNFSALKENDSYHRSNSYNLPSSARLLVMGREYGNAMPDKGYVFWGDDDAPTTTYTSPADTLWHIMNRTWLVKTNVQSTADSLATRWTGNGLEVSRDGFLDDITQETATAGAFAVTPAMPKNAGDAGHAEERRLYRVPVPYKPPDIRRGIRRERRQRVRIRLPLRQRRFRADDFRRPGFQQGRGLRRQRQHGVIAKAGREPLPAHRRCRQR